MNHPLHSLGGASLLLPAVLAAGCGKPEPAVKSGKAQVVTRFTIIADMAREVAGDAADVESIT
jgi:manganese/iron transport system substrate-binding protein